MSLLLDLYSNSSVLKRVDLGIGNSRSKKPVLQSGIDKNDIIIDVESVCILDSDYKESVITGIRNERSCFEFLNSYIDSYFNVYTLNVVDKFQDHYVHVYSLQNLLAVVLNHMCDFDVNNVDKIDNFDAFSKDILEMKFTENFYLKSLFGADPNLDEVIKDVCKSNSCELDILKDFISRVNTNMTNMLKYIGTYIESNTPMVLISIDKSKILFRSMHSEGEEVIVNYNGIQFKLNPLVSKEEFDYYKNYKGFNYGEVLCLTDS